MPFGTSRLDFVRVSISFVFVPPGLCHVFVHIGWHVAWVNRKMLGSKGCREDEMYLINVTAYQVSMFDTCHVVLYLCTVPVPIEPPMHPNLVACR